MKTALITGSSGLVGAEAVRFFSNRQFAVIGIDNDLRSYFFGPEASTAWCREKIESEVKDYLHYQADIRDEAKINEIFTTHGRDIDVIIHTAAQPSHDWAAKEPITDFTINANGTLNLLENMRKHCPRACFIFTSTNKVYGDTPNSLPLVEQDSRWELEPSHPFYNGIDESMTIDQSKHSLFGASKIAADILVQEYGRYFNLKTACFRGGCITGPGHSGAVLHGFLAYLMQCAISGETYHIYGYKGKQVRDNIHSYDLVKMFWHFYRNPLVGEVYNAGGSRFSNCSLKEAVQLCEKIAGKKMDLIDHEENRSGDHIWWISSVDKFKTHYPEWDYRYGLEQILEELFIELTNRIK